jgi:GNAT superfamily N-acetyltransferase
MMQVFIREVTINDSETVAGLTAQLGYETTVAATTELIAEILNRKDDIALVAVINGKIAGWIHAFYAVRLESGRFAEIGGLVVDGQHRGQGIGKMLVAEVKQWSRRRQIASLKVRCSTKRLASHRFYLQNGFTELKEQKIFELNI